MTISSFTGNFENCSIYVCDFVTCDFLEFINTFDKWLLSPYRDYPIISVVLHVGYIYVYI